MLSILALLAALCVWLAYGGWVMSFIQDKCDDWGVSQFIGFGVWIFLLFAPIIIVIGVFS